MIRTGVSAFPAEFRSAISDWLLNNVAGSQPKIALVEQTRKDYSDQLEFIVDAFLPSRGRGYRRVLYISNEVTLLKGSAL